MGKLHREYPNLLIGNSPFFVLIGVSIVLLYNGLSLVLVSTIPKIILAIVIFNVGLFITKKILFKTYHKFHNVEYKHERQLTEQEMKDNMKIGDPFADEIITKIIENKIKFSFPNYYELKENKIVKEEMEKILKEMKRVPSWVDKKKIADSKKFYMDNVAMIFSGLSQGLIKSYTYPSEANVLKISGGLVGVDETVKRLNRTTQFVWDVVSSSGPYFDTPAFQQIFNVRLIHALVRHSVLKSSEWKEDYIPVSQFSEAGTLTFFCQIPIETLLKRGIIVSEYEKDCCWQLWRYVGYLLGFKEELLSTYYRTGVIAQEQPHVLQLQKPNELSRLLTLDTINALDKDVKVPFSVPLFEVSLEYTLGQEVYKKLDLPPNNLIKKIPWHFLSSFWAFVRIVEILCPLFATWKNYFIERYFYRCGLLVVRKCNK